MMQGGYSVEDGIAGDDPYSRFGDKEIRLGFIRKVYGILTAQIICTFAFVCAFSLSENSRKWAASNIWLLWVAMIVTIVVILALSCCESVRRTSPQNFIALFIFTLAESFLVGVISSMYYWKIVLTAVVITAVICFALTLFAFQTKIDFTVYNGLLFVLCLVLMLFGIITMFWKDSIVHLIYACFGALLFSAYLVVDTQMIVGGTHSQQISSEEYIFAALTLYLDIINIFMYILQILKSLNDN